MRNAQEPLTIHLHNEWICLDRAESLGFLLPPHYDDRVDRVEDLPGVWCWKRCT